MSGTLEDVKALRAELAARRRDEALWLSTEKNRERVERLVELHFAIEALDRVLAEERRADTKNA
jgi:hypothetical protein